MDPKMLIRRYRDEAVACRLWLGPGHAPRRLRVATTLLSAELAAAVLNEMGLPPEPASSYRHVNVHNPRHALRHDRRRGGWVAVPGLEQHPVWGLNWDAAVLLCRQLGARLPTAAEWEGFAAGGEPGVAYPWGDAEPSPARANYDEHYAGTTPVGTFPPNALGLYDLAGNLAEWCEDAPPGGPASERVAKGGAWSKGAGLLHIRASRSKWARLGTTTIGLRPVWD
ncbi:formylglycine-generating enzyme family protein [Ideonella sp.]|uniref:formylglycine-generating enzyme family protein n=1 Tax=Ideonella sp. TaxID=1929293 RepID=UPI002B45A6FC|nr:SUMF1/EgtB/PvdO family nonheme iron enzyme [Ideonella sp.]HJV68786.1 SUMF1/EgtB/PvdO family nonheme iron enzyme [Ideonella sp.]